MSVARLLPRSAAAEVAHGTRAVTGVAAILGTKAVRNATGPCIEDSTGITGEVAIGTAALVYSTYYVDGDGDGDGDGYGTSASVQQCGPDPPEQVEPPALDRPKVPQLALLVDRETQVVHIRSVQWRSTGCWCNSRSRIGCCRRTIRQ